MRKNMVFGISVFLMAAMFVPGKVLLASLSASLGATKLDGLTHFADCQNQSVGYREGLIADRLELKLANTPKMSPEARAQWLNDIRILRQVQQTRQADRTNSQHYLLGLSDREQVAINSMSVRYSQEINLKCEQQYGGMTRYSPGSDQSGQRNYENSLRAQMGQPIDIATVPVEALTEPKSNAEIALERKAADKERMQAAMQKFSQCTASSKALRPKLVAQMLQHKLESSPNLSAKERSEIQADIQAAWVSAGKGLDLIESADPKNPYRAEQHLSPQEMTDLNTQYAQQYAQAVQACATSGMPHPLS